MTAPVFVDTNVLVYATDLADPRKQELARNWLDELWTSETGRVSFQVLQEFCAMVSQKSPSTRGEARATVRDFLSYRPLPIRTDRAQYIVPHSSK